MVCPLSKKAEMRVGNDQFARKAAKQDHSATKFQLQFGPAVSTGTCATLTKLDCETQGLRTSSTLSF
jgi:hypothetical protein